MRRFYNAASEKWRYCRAHKAFHAVHTPLHSVYFLFVALEAHGTYGIVAAVLLIVTLPDNFFPGDAE